MPEQPITPPLEELLDLVSDEVVMFDCPTCGAEHHYEEDAAECCRVYACSHCGTEYRDDEEAYDCCRYYCGECCTEYRYQEDADDCCQHACPSCGSRWDDAEDANNCCGRGNWNGHLPHLEEVAPYWMEVVDLPGRPARLCSFEQELVKGGEAVAQLLYNVGAADRTTVLSYHHASSRPGLVHVEEDGSLPSEGGEVIFDRFNLSQRDDIGTMSKALTKIRQLRDHGDRDSRLVKTGFAAGIHVHVSARATDGTMFGPRDVAALYELWCYAEDMLYSLSASGWNRHRQPSDNYSGYCKPVPKERVRCRPTVSPHGTCGT